MISDEAETRAASNPGHGDLRNGTSLSAERRRRRGESVTNVVDVTNDGDVTKERRSAGVDQSRRQRRLPVAFRCSHVRSGWR